MLAYLQTPAAVRLYELELPLRRGWIPPGDNMTSAGVLRDASPDSWSSGRSSLSSHTHPPVLLEDLGCTDSPLRRSHALRSCHDSLQDVHVMKRPVTAFVLALVSVILCPILLFIEFTALFGAGMIAYEPANPIWVKVLAFVFVGVVGLLALALPVIVILLGRKARAASSPTGTTGSGLAKAAVVIGVIVTLAVLAVQVLTAASMVVG